MAGLWHNYSEGALCGQALTPGTYGAEKEDNMSKNAELIAAGSAVLGIEFGSTRIKAVLIDDEFKPIAQEK